MLVLSRVLAATLAAGYLVPYVQVSADMKNEARALFEYAQHRENRALDGMRWHWLHERGKCHSISDGLSGDFEATAPVDSYECRWLANGGVYFFESIAQQGSREIDGDKEQGILLTTLGSEVFLSTADSRVSLFTLDQSASIHGQMQNRTHGFLPSWGPGAFLLHASSLRVGGVSYLLERLAQPEVTVIVESGKSSAGIECRIVRLEGTDNTEESWYFSSEELVLVQRESKLDDRVRSQSVVLGTEKAIGDGEAFVVPAVVVSSFQPEGDALWTVDRYATTQVQMERVALTDMVLPIDSPRCVLYPHGRVQSPKESGSITAENVDEVVKVTFAKSQDAWARWQSQHPKTGGEPVAPDGRIVYLFVFNALLLICAVGVYAYKRLR